MRNVGWRVALFLKILCVVAVLQTASPTTAYCGSSDGDCRRVARYAGSGVDGTADGTSLSAKFGLIEAVAADFSGNLYVVDYWYCTVRKIFPNRSVVTIAGGKGTGTCGFKDGAALSVALFSSPEGVAVVGNAVFIADTANCCIRKYINGQVSTAAGHCGTYFDASNNGYCNYPGFVDGTGTASQFDTIYGMSVDSSSRMYIADGGNNAVRVMYPNFTVRTVYYAAFNAPFAVAVNNAGTLLYVADTYNHSIRVVDLVKNTSFVLAGNGTAGYKDGSSNRTTMFNHPMGVEILQNGDLMVSDTYNHLLRTVEVSTGRVKTVAGVNGTSGYAGGVGDNVLLYYPMGLAVLNRTSSNSLGQEAAMVFLADRANYMVRSILNFTSTVSYSFHTLETSASCSLAVSRSLASASVDESLSASATQSRSVASPSRQYSHSVNSHSVSGGSFSLPSSHSRTYSLKLKVTPTVAPSTSHTYMTSSSGPYSSNTASRTDSDGSESTESSSSSTPSRILTHSRSLSLSAVSDTPRVPDKIHIPSATWLSVETASPSQLERSSSTSTSSRTRESATWTALVPRTFSSSTSNTPRFSVTPTVKRHPVIHTTATYSPHPITVRSSTNAATWTSPPVLTLSVTLPGETPPSSQLPTEHPMPASVVQAGTGSSAAATATIAVSAVLSGGAAVDGGSLAALGMMGCTQPSLKASVGPLRFLLSPFVDYGPVAMAFGNIALVVAVAIAQFIAVVLFIHRGNSSMSGPPLSRARFPQLTLVASTFLLQGMLRGVFGVVLSAATAWNAGDVLCVIAGCGALIAFAYTYHKAVVWASANTTYDVASGPHPNFAQWWPRWTVSLQPRALWYPKAARYRCGVVFQGMHGIANIPLSAIPVVHGGLFVTISVIDVSAHGSTACATQYFWLATITLPLCGVYVIRAPLRDRVSCVLTAASYGCLGLLALVLGVNFVLSPAALASSASFTSSLVPALSLGQTFVLILKSIFAFSCWFTERRDPMLETHMGKEADTLDSRVSSTQRGIALSDVLEALAAAFSPLDGLTSSAGSADDPHCRRRPPQGAESTGEGHTLEKHLLMEFSSSAGPGPPSSVSRSQSMLDLAEQQPQASIGTAAVAAKQRSREDLVDLDVDAEGDIFSFWDQTGRARGISRFDHSVELVDIPIRLRDDDGLQRRHRKDTATVLTFRNQSDEYLSDLL